MATVYNYHRNYDPHLGRYVQPDPIGLAGGLNPYLYADANPLRNVDPTGLVVRVSTGGKPEYDAAVAYLRRDPGMARIIDDLESSKTVYTVSLNSDDQDEFDPDTNFIYWDPGSALACKDGGTQSPALGLGHEMAHADFNSLLRWLLWKTTWFAGDYQNLEEWRVISGAETRAAKTLGEGTRTDHRFGHTIRVPTPTSRRP
jgi:hypothetical protein